MSVAHYRKAVASGVVTAATALSLAVADLELTALEGLGALLAGVIAAGTVYLTPNEQTDEQRALLRYEAAREGGLSEAEAQEEGWPEGRTPGSERLDS